jgi:glycosyltransferase involved in cell wall biosynthesis
LLREAEGVVFTVISESEQAAIAGAEVRRIGRLAGLGALPFVSHATLQPLSRVKRSRPWRAADSWLQRSRVKLASKPVGTNDRARAPVATRATDSARGRRLASLLVVPGSVWRRIARSRLSGEAASVPEGAHAALRQALNDVPATSVPFLHLHLAHRLHEHARFAAAVLLKLAQLRMGSGWQPDVVQAHDTHALFAGAAVSRSLGVPLVYDAVEIPEHQIRSANRPRWTDAADLVMRTAERPIIQEAARLITIGESLAEWYRANHNLQSAVTVVRNCRNFCPAVPDGRLRADCGIGPETPLMVWFGGASPHRGMEFVVELLARLEEFHAALITEFRPFWEPYRQDLLRLIEARGVGARLHILPMRSPNDLIPYASGADIGTFAFTGELPLNVKYSLPNKVFEMTMARLPIAATPLDNVSRIISGLGNGIELDDDYAAAARAIESLYARRRDPAFRDRLESAARSLSWEHEKQALTGLYDELAATIHR